MEESTTIQQWKNKNLRRINRKHSYLFYIPHGFNRFFSLLDVFIWQTLFSFWQTISQSKQRRKKTSTLASNIASINWLYSSCFEKRLFQNAFVYYVFLCIWKGKMRKNHVDVFFINSFFWKEKRIFFALHCLWYL